MHYSWLFSTHSLLKQFQSGFIETAYIKVTVISMLPNFIIYSVLTLLDLVAAFYTVVILCPWYIFFLWIPEQHISLVFLLFYWSFLHRFIWWFPLFIILKCPRVWSLILFFTLAPLVNPNDIMTSHRISLLMNLKFGFLGHACLCHKFWTGKSNYLLTTCTWVSNKHFNLTQSKPHPWPLSVMKFLWFTDCHKHFGKST